MTSALEARVAAVNRCHGFAKNILYPQLRHILEPFVGKQVRLKTGSLAVSLTKVLKQFDFSPNRDIDIFRSVSEYSLAWTIRVTEQYERGHQQAELTVYFGSLENGTHLKSLEYPQPTARDDYTAEAVTQLRKEYEVAKKAADDAQSALFPFGTYDRG